MAKADLLKEAQELGIDIPAGATVEQLQGLIAEKKEEGETLKVKILKSPAGKFLRSEPIGWVGEYPIGLATEMIEAKYAEKA